MEIDELETQSSKLMTQLYTLLKKHDLGCNKLSKDIESYKTSLEHKEGGRIKREKGYLEDEKEQLKVSRGHVEKDLKHVDDERETTERGIERQTKEHQVEQEKLKERNDTLEKEITDLRALLEKKILEKERVQSDLDQVSGKIGLIRAKFKKQLERIETKREKALEELRATENEIAGIDRKISEIDSEESTLSNALKEYAAQQEFIGEERRRFQQEITKLDEQNTSREKSTSQMIARRELYLDELQKVKLLEEKAAKSTSIIKRIDLDIETLEQEVKMIDEKVPLLEKEKKVAAAARNFLEANKISKEIKEKKDQVDGINEKIQQLRGEREEVSASEPQKEKEINEYKAKLAGFKRDYEASIYNLLEFRVKDLEQLLGFFDSQNGWMSRVVSRSELDKELKWCQARRTEIFELYKDYFKSLEASGDSSENSIQVIPSQPPSRDVQEPKSSSDQDKSQEDHTLQAAAGDQTVETSPNPEETFDANTTEPVDIEGLQAQIDEANTKIRELEAKYNQVEQEIESASEREDFELAESLNTENNERKDELTKLANLISDWQVKINSSQLPSN